MTTGEIMTTLAGLTYYSGQTYTVEERFQTHDSNFEEFRKFPLILVVDGDETNEPVANRTVRVTYNPTLHFYAENMSTTNLKLWRENIRNAVLSSASLWTGDNYVNVDSITINEANDRKLQHMEFNLTIGFDKKYTIA